MDFPFVPLLQQALELDQLYRTTSTISFTLLGLWWFVVQMRFSGGLGSLPARRHAYGIMIFFLLPGVMSLFSLIDNSGTWWRLVFGVTATIGMTEIALHYYSTNGQMAPESLALRSVGFMTYLLMILTAIRPTIASDLNIGLTGLQVEAILVSTLLIIGVHLAFLTMVENQTESPSS